MRDAEHDLIEGKPLQPNVYPESQPPEGSPAIPPPAPSGKSRAIGTVFAGQVLRVVAPRPDAYAAFLEEL
jgi:hypothetical protein